MLQHGKSNPLNLVDEQRYKQQDQLQTKQNEIKHFYFPNLCDTVIIILPVKLTFFLYSLMPFVLMLN